MSQQVIPEVESPVEATEAETVASDAAPKESQETGDAPATQEKADSTPAPSQQQEQQQQEESEESTEAVKRSAEELSQASQEEVTAKKVRVLEGGDNAQSQELPAEV